MTDSVSATVGALRDDVWLMMMGSSMQQTNDWMVKDRAEGVRTNRGVLIKDASFWEVVKGLMGDNWERCVRARWLGVFSRMQKGDGCALASLYLW